MWTVTQRRILQGAIEVQRQAGRRNGVFHHRLLRLSSSSASKEVPKGVQETAKSLTWMSAQVSIHGDHAAREWASKLSPSAQSELTQLMHKSRTNIAEAVTVPEPSRRDLKLVMLQQAIPFVGFGIMDNAILILAGDAIDTSLGVTLGISTMCAAAIGNIVSDVVGIMFGTIIEDFTAKLGLPIPQISAAQRQLRSVRFSNQLGCAIGIVIGCIIGMFPLLLIDSNKIHRLKQEAHMNAIFKDVVDKAKELIGAEVTNLYIIVDSKDCTTPFKPSTASKASKGKQLGEPNQQYFYSKHGIPIHIPVGRGVISRTAVYGRIENIKDASNDPDVAKAEWKIAFPGLDIRSMVCVPVFDSQGKVIAILQAINKQSKGITRRDSNYTYEKHAVFTKTDESILKVLASHIAVSIQNMYEADVEMSLKETIDILVEQGLAGLPERQILSLPMAPPKQEAEN